MKKNTGVSGASAAAPASAPPPLPEGFLDFFLPLHRAFEARRRC